jgi:hypothetical protein
MIRHVPAYLGIGLLLFVSGCAICASPYDSHYAAHGGSWDRADPSEGRVASVFHPAGATGQSMVEFESKGWTPGTAEYGGRSIMSPGGSGTNRSDGDTPPDLDYFIPD